MELVKNAINLRADSKKSGVQPAKTVHIAKPSNEPVNVAKRVKETMARFPRVLARLAK